MTADLFGAPAATGRAVLGQNAFVLRGFALSHVDELIPALSDIESVSPFRRMITPGGFEMSVALTNCGELGWQGQARAREIAP